MSDKGSQNREIGFSVLKKARMSAVSRERYADGGIAKQGDNGTARNRYNYCSRLKLPEDRLEEQLRHMYSANIPLLEKEGRASEFDPFGVYYKNWANDGWVFYRPASQETAQKSNWPEGIDKLIVMEIPEDRYSQEIKKLITRMEKLKQLKRPTEKQLEKLKELTEEAEQSMEMQEFAQKNKNKVICLGPDGRTYALKYGLSGTKHTYPFTRNGNRRK